ncbi:MAG: metallophosphoesterase [Sulfurovum sp.]
MNFILFFSVFITLLISVHYLFYSRVVKKLLVSHQTQNILKASLVLNLIFNILYIIGRYSDIVNTPLYYLFSLSLGISFILLMYLIVHEILNLFHKSIKSIDISKREFIKKSGDTALLGVSTAYLSIGVYEGSKEPIINVVPFHKFDFSIVQISDLHIGGLIDREFVKHSVVKINSVKPDIVCITGDLIDTAIESIADIVLELNKIEAKHGIYFILGNHEYFHNVEEIMEFVKTKTNMTLLLNENLQIDELKLNIIGVTDMIGYRMEKLEPNIDKAFEGINPNYKSLFLVHQPKFIEELGSYKPDLILSGHTHGGQIWPFEYLTRLQQPFVKGLHQLENKKSYIYVNSGIGFWGPPMRINSQSEIAYII